MRVHQKLIKAQSLLTATLWCLCHLKTKHDNQLHKKDIFIYCLNTMFQKLPFSKSPFSETPRENIFPAILLHSKTHKKKSQKI